MSTGAPGNGSVPGITLDWASADVRRVLSRALDGEDVSVADAMRLAEANGRDVHALTLVADEMRRRQAGDVVTFVVNRNVNFTNVCIKHCTFCAFSRDHREEEGYLLPTEEVVRRAQEAWDLGATEVCIQAGLPPKRWGSGPPPRSCTATSRPRSTGSATWRSCAACRRRPAASPSSCRSR